MRAKQLNKKFFKNGKTFKLFNNNFSPRKEVLLKVNVDFYMVKGKIYHWETGKELADIYQDTFNYSECGKAIEVL